MVEITETGGRMVVIKGTGELLFNNHRASVSLDEKILKMNER